MPLLPSSVFELVFRHDVAHQRVAELGRPVPAGRARDVPLIVRGRVDVDFDDANAGVGCVLGNPLRIYEHGWNGGRHAVAPCFIKGQLYNDNGAGRNRGMDERMARRPGATGASAATKAPHFPTAALAFLRALKRNNDREWFKARKDRYELVVRTPLVADHRTARRGFQGVRTRARRRAEGVDVPHLPRHAVLRKPGAAQNRGRRRVPVARNGQRHRGAGLYFEVTPQGCGPAADCTRRTPHSFRRSASTWRRTASGCARLSKSPAFRRRFGQLEGERLQRVPRGFPKDHAAAEYLKHRQFIGGREFPAAFACSPRFYAGILDVFKHVAPLARFLNEPLLGNRSFDHLRPRTVLRFG